MIRRALLVGLLGVLLTAHPARATQPDTSRPIYGPNVEAVSRLADDYWLRARGLSRPAPARFFRMDWDEITFALAAPGGDTIWLTNGLIYYIHHGERWGRIEARELLCATVLHERGHNMGLAHEPRGIMSVAPPSPRVCKKWAEGRTEFRQIRRTAPANTAGR